MHPPTSNKSMRLSSASRNESSSGQIVNLMSTDAGQSMERAILLIYPLFLSPCVIAVVLYLLYREIGASAYAGLAVIVATMPVSLFIFVKLTKIFQQNVAHTDQRLQLVNEALQAIATLKLYSWELPFMRKIEEVRALELKKIRAHAYYFSVGINAVFLQLPYLIQFVAFSTYYHGGNDMLPWIIFTALQLFSLLQQQLTQLPQALAQMSRTIVSLQRIGTFLMLPELELDDFFEYVATFARVTLVLRGCISLLFTEGVLYLVLATVKEANTQGPPHTGRRSRTRAGTRRPSR